MNEKSENICFDLAFSFKSSGFQAYAVERMRLGSTFLIGEIFVFAQLDLELKVFREVILNFN